MEGNGGNELARLIGVARESTLSPNLGDKGDPAPRGGGLRRRDTCALKQGKARQDKHNSSPEDVVKVFHDYPALPFGWHE